MRVCIPLVLRQLCALSAIDFAAPSIKPAVLTTAFRAAKRQKVRSDHMIQAGEKKRRRFDCGQLGREDPFVRLSAHIQGSIRKDYKGFTSI